MSVVSLNHPINPYPSISGGGTVDFQEFVGGLSAFSSRGGREEKLKCWFLFFSYVSLIIRPLVAFKVYDVDRDGFISNGELFLVLKMMVGNNLKVPSFPSFSVSFFIGYFACRTNNYSKSWTRRSWKPTLTATEN